MSDNIYEYKRTKNKIHFFVFHVHWLCMCVAGWWIIICRVLWTVWSDISQKENNNKKTDRTNYGRDTKKTGTMWTGDIERIVDVRSAHKNHRISYVWCGMALTLHRFEFSYDRPILKRIDCDRTNSSEQHFNAEQIKLEKMIKSCALAERK